MANEQVKQLLKTIDQLKIPQNDTILNRAEYTYNNAREKLMAYRGKPDVLVEALRMFIETGCRPYAYAGISQALFTAATADKIDQEGLNHALQWLTKAQEIADNRVEINVIEADLYIAMNRLDDARAVLDALQEEDYIDSDIARSEMRYWEKKKEMKRVAAWYKKAHELARSEPEQFSLLNQIAGIYFANKMYAEALKAYQAIVKKTPTDYWAWHQMSIIHLRNDDLKQAADCNDHAMQLADFSAAQKVRTTIKERSSLSYRFSQFWKNLGGKSSKR